jgi:hypothetical protein
VSFIDAMRGDDALMEMVCGQCYFGLAMPFSSSNSSG